MSKVLAAGLVLARGEHGIGAGEVGEESQGGILGWLGVEGRSGMLSQLPQNSP